MSRRKRRQLRQRLKQYTIGTDVAVIARWLDELASKQTVVARTRGN